MKLYDDGKTGIALEPHYVETHAGNLHVYEDRTQAGDIVFITTDKFKKYIPIEWLLDYVSHWVSEPYKNFVLNMIKTWEKENGTEESVRNI